MSVIQMILKILRRCNVIISLLRKKWRYYGHCSQGFVKDYFGYIGDKVEVSIIIYFMLKITGFRTTKEYIRA